MARSALPLAIVLVALFAGGCAAEARPPAEGEETPAAEETVAVETPVTITAPTEKAPACAAGATRKCTIYWSYNGTAQCLMSWQACRKDELGWTACGQLATP